MPKDLQTWLAVVGGASFVIGVLFGILIERREREEKEDMVRSTLERIGIISVQSRQASHDMSDMNRAAFFAMADEARRYQE